MKLDDTIFPFTRPADYDKCHPEIKKAILAGQQIYCSVIDPDDGSSGFDWIVGFISESNRDCDCTYFGVYYHYIQAQPVAVALQVVDGELPNMDMTKYRETGEIVPYVE
jgi:hypothetical protein